MIVSEAFRGKRYAVLGLARSGLATVRSLVASGAEVVAWDSNEDARDALFLSSEAGEGDHPKGGGGAIPTPAPLPLPHASHGPPPQAGLGEEKLTLADPLEIDLTGFDGVVVSPGVPINTHPIGDKARAANVPLIGDIELFALARPSLPPHKVVGITGTNGKSTTTALIHHILKTAGVPTTMGGNIGLPILGQDPLPEGGVYVLELSSYQIDLTYSLDCDVAVLLNITPDHLDRYDSFEAYAASKARLFDMQVVPKVADHCSAFVVVDDALTERIRNDWDAFRIGDTDLERELKEQQPDWPTLQGPHNLKNALAAASAAFATEQVSFDDISSALRTYPGLPHRMERVRELEGVLYVNDSKATNADSCAPALAAYPALHWILGGQAKTKELDACKPHFSNVRAAYTIGEAGPMFAELLKPHMPVTESGTLEQAVVDAHKAAKPGETVLLSPACASWDQFRDFEHRGDVFRAAVEALA